jgi:hypothetical protein
MPTITLELTRADIDNALADAANRQSVCRTCIIAHALRRRGYADAQVGQWTSSSDILSDLPIRRCSHSDLLLSGVGVEVRQAPNDNDVRGIDYAERNYSDRLA